MARRQGGAERPEREENGKVGPRRHGDLGCKDEIGDGQPGIAELGAGRVTLEHCMLGWPSSDVKYEVS